MYTHERYNMKVSHTALKEKIFIIYCWNILEKGNITHSYTWDHSECSIAIMTDVSADPVHGKVVLSILIYHPLKFTKMLTDITDIFKSALIRVILPIPVIDAA